MIIILILLSCSQAIALVYIVMCRRKEHKEMEYLKNKIQQIIQRDEHENILIPTENSYIKDTVFEINELLNAYHQRKRIFEKKERELSQVLTNLSHDIRTPITVLKGNCEILLAQMQEKKIEAEIYSSACRVDKKADELISNVNDYFMLSKITSGDLVTDRQQTNVVKVCNEVLLSYYDQLEQMDFDVYPLEDRTPVWIQTDAMLLQRILGNLIQNVIRHGYSGKYLGLRLTEDDSKIKIFIEDHGKGIAAENLEKIFDRSYTTASKSSGNGLGLAIAEQLVHKLGGEISVQSIPNVKTVFSIILNR